MAADGSSSDDEVSTRGRGSPDARVVVSGTVAADASSSDDEASTRGQCAGDGSASALRYTASAEPAVEDVEDLAARPLTVEQGTGAVCGRVHSVETFSCVDGPGLRAVVFLQGCDKRCVFCCSPDTWARVGASQVRTAADVIQEVGKNSAYLRRAGGGITISGGEPLLQPEFCAALADEAHKRGLTVVIDTAGEANPKAWRALLPKADAILFCVKAASPETYKSITTVEQAPALEFFRATSAYGVPTWVRLVLMKGVTDTEEELKAVARLAKSHKALRGVELLPLHHFGEFKYACMGIKYPLEGVEGPSPSDVRFAESVIRREGVHVIS